MSGLSDALTRPLGHVACDLARKAASGCAGAVTQDVLGVIIFAALMLAFSVWFIGLGRTQG